MQLLRVSGQNRQKSFELRGVTDRSVDVGVDDEDVLLAFADAVFGGPQPLLDGARSALLHRMGPGGLVEAAVTAANFSLVDRVANSVGIPLDDMAIKQTADFRAPLGINDFPSARNTPRA